MILSVQYLKYQDIDKQKWDACISNASNGLIYGYSYYLDAMAKNWDSLVLNDYEQVMPLTWNKKYGIHYLYQPFFCASLGIFGNNIQADTVSQFLHAIPSHFKYWDFYLNPGNLFSVVGYTLFERTNLVLDLNKPYEDLYEAYRDNVKRNIKKSNQHGFIIQKDFSVDEVIHYAALQSQQFSPIKEDDYSLFKQLYSDLHKSGHAMTYGLYSANKELMASCVFFFSHNRAYYILVGNNPNGKTMGASHALIDAFIKENANKNLLLDFEGSDVPSLSFFYSSFGAITEKYPGIKQNKMPLWIKWLKK